MNTEARRSASGADPRPVDFQADSVSVRHPARRPDSPPALSDFSIAIGHGEQIAVIGASGAGKSTMLALLAMAREPFAGHLAVFERAPWTMPSAERHRLRRRLFLAPQAPPLPPRQRVVDAVLAGRLPGWSLPTAVASLVRPRDAVAARDALARFALDDKLFDRVDRLSGGERQRVALARLCVSDAEAFLVDEPLSALDPVLADRAIAALQDVARERGATLVCSLHQVEVALARFPRLIGLRAGRVVFDLPRDAVDAAMLDTLYAEASAVAGEPPASFAVEREMDVDAPLGIADGSRL